MSDQLLTVNGTELLTVVETSTDTLDALSVGASDSLVATELLLEILETAGDPGLVTVSADGSVEVLEVPTPAADLVEVAGPQGPPGPQGAAGPSGGSAMLLTTNSALGGHRIVYMAGGYPQYADCTAISHANHVLGMTLTATNSGDTASIVRNGDVTEPTWNWDTTKPVYLGTNGVPTQTPPSNAAFSLIVGIPKTPTTLFVALREPIVLS